MKKIRKILSAISAVALCNASFAGITSNAAGNEKLNTYAVYCDVDSNSGIMWADVYFHFYNIDMDSKEVKTGNFGGDVTHTTVTQVNNEIVVYGASFRAGGAIMAPGILFKSRFWTPDNMKLVDGTMRTSAFDTKRKFMGNDIVNASFVLIGDANEDGNVDIADETAITQSLGNPQTYGLTKKGNYAADVNFDGVVNNDDIKLIRDYNNGVIDWFE
ncbi:MAG: dockerin type I repeat-containing protein [Alistipes senegalensis]|nr:dockerin type I repeat-containing protein [Alistipes senegalensis]